ncbi:ATP-binding domain-containing protein [Streptacidiphilus sp. PB12-B1b]|uniref:ATP-binding domain-containing protein n=1 Tax=Streptacidiphilus sp. PB12-B1b TaxID=2705012 RepID=UPI0015FC8CBA|nr:ATP-binding domain-containing protein [Streptacidiphilus sp. PB12-B1b]QMU76508.1 ATP-binding domain-containing protein [Streptacidiphilus sp. PB12-B1b]
MNPESAATAAAAAEPAPTPPAQTPAELAALAEAMRAVAAGSSTGSPSAGPGSGPSGAGGPDQGAAGAAVPGRAEALRATAEVLAAGGAPAQLLDATVAALGEGAPALLREDPWSILTVPGVRPEHADGFARGLLGADCGPGDPRRAQALAVWLLEQAARYGHTAVELAGLAAGLDKQGVPDAEEALAAILGEGRVMAFQEEEQPAGGRRADEDEEPPVRVLLALDRLALAEESLADGLVRLMSTFEGDPQPSVTDGSGDAPEGGSEGDDPAVEGSAVEAPDGDGSEGDGSEGGADASAVDDEPAVLDWAGAADAAPSPSAAALIRAVAEAGLVLHTGGLAARAEPVALVRAARALGLRACVTAATEDGRRALGDEQAVTLSGLLGGAEGPGRVDGALALDLLVVCDAPALDVETAATLVESVADGARLVLSGDPSELWSAGPGRVFADLLAARACPVVASRTPDFGPIGELVSGIGIGELLPVEAPDKEVVIVTARDAEETAHRALQLVRDSIPRALGIPADQVRVVTPAHAGPAGTRALNTALKQLHNPGPGAFGGFDPGDQVVHSPAPGLSRPATVRSGGPEGLVLDCEGQELRIPREQVAGVLRHGWALTAHQAAGRRWPGVVVLLPPEAAPELTRQWVYSAFSRAERHLSVVHAVGPALPQAVTGVPARPRTTRLRGILAEQTADLDG